MRIVDGPTRHDHAGGAVIVAPSVEPWAHRALSADAASPILAMRAADADHRLPRTASGAVSRLALVLGASGGMARDLCRRAGRSRFGFKGGRVVARRRALVAGAFDLGFRIVWVAVEAVLPARGARRGSPASGA